MKFSTFLLGGVAALGLSSAAFAADLIVDTPVATPIASATTDWTGFYLGGSIGYGAGTLTLDPTDIDIDADDVDEDVQGWLAGVQLGYNWQVDSLLFGIQTDVSLSGIHYDEDEDGADDTIDWLGSTTGRIGFVADSFVPYLKGGVAYGGGTGHFGDEEDSQNMFGWTVGAGVEFAVADNMSVFAEYDYYNFGDTTFSFDEGDVDVDADLHTVKVGLNFKF